MVVSLDKASTYGFKAHSTMHWVSPFFSLPRSSRAWLWYLYEFFCITLLFLRSCFYIINVSKQKTTYFMVVSMWCLPTIWMWLFKLQPSAIILFDDSHMQGINKEVFPRVRVNSNSLKLLFFPIAKRVGVLSIMVGLTNVSKGLVK